MYADTLAPTHFLDRDHPLIRDFVDRHAGAGDDVARAVNLYYALRDRIDYDVRAVGVDEDLFVASNVLQAPTAFCVPKAVLLATVARAASIPSRIGFADVRNHVTTAWLAALMDGDVFRWHAYTSLYLDGRWVKATPAFDIGLCERHGLKPLEFDGRSDSIFHPYDRDGHLHMEYVNFIGEFADTPHAEFAAAMRSDYPRLLFALTDGRDGAAGPPAPGH